jgi:hypothetical protein
MMAHSLVLMRNQVAELQAANEASTRPTSHKKERIQREETLPISEGLRLTALKESNAHSDNVARQGTTHERARIMRKVL